VSSQKTNELYIRIRQLHDTHCEAALNSGNWCLLAVHDEVTGLSIALFLGDRRFRLNGYIDSQNNSSPCQSTKCHYLISRLVHGVLWVWLELPDLFYLIPQGYSDKLFTYWHHLSKSILESGVPCTKTPQQFARQTVLCFVWRAFLAEECCAGDCVSPLRQIWIFVVFRLIL